MGLSETKKRQRIGPDPNNTTWTQSKSKFGYKMLQKMGWAEGNGLGKDGNGTTVNIPLVGKEDMRGIGADTNKEVSIVEGFEKVLEKLNKNEKKEKKRKRKEKEIKIDRLAHRRKFQKNKDVTAYSKEDLKAIFGQC